jgi:protoporphyrinogen oxidase
LKKIFQLEQRYGSIIKGLIKTRNDKKTEDPIHFLFNDLNLKDYSDILNKYSIYYLKDGMEILTKTLVKYLQTLPNVELISNQMIKKIEFLDNQVEILTQTNKKYHLNHLISAVPAFELANLIDNQILRSRLNQIPFVNMIIINLLYKKEDIFPKQAFGYLIPSREHSHLLGVLFDSCIRYTTDKNKHGSQITVMMGGVWFDELRLGQCTDEQLMHIVMNELKKQMNLDEKPAVYSISRLNKAIPVCEIDF